MTLGCASAQGMPGGEARAPQDAPRLYVANQEPATVSIIDIGSHEVMETIDLRDLGFTPGAKPHHTAVEPDGSFWYLSLIADGRVLKFNRDNELVAQVEFETPGMLALHPERDLLFVGRSMAAVNPPQRIGVITRSSMELEEWDVFIPRPHAIVVDPRGTHLYTASLAANQVVSVDLETERIEVLSLDGETHVMVQFTMTPGSSELVAAGQISGKVLVFDASEPMALRLDRTVNVNAWPWHPTYTRDGRTVYVGNQQANTVSAIDAATWEVKAVIEGEGLAEPHGIATSPDGRYVYVSNRNLDGSYVGREDHGDRGTGTVVVIDTTTNEIVRVIEVDRYAAGMGTQGMW